MHQLFIKFPAKLEYLDDDFIIGDANKIAYEYIVRWPDWNAGLYPKILLVYGEDACGKTHLAHIWQNLAKAKFINQLDFKDFTNQALIVEDIENIDQETLLHIINFAHEKQVYLLLTSKLSPAKLKFSLADLNSRILALNSLEIASPDQDLLKAVLFKNLSDRQLNIDANAIENLIIRIDRSFAKLFSFVEALNSACRTQKRVITIPLIKQVLESSNF